MDSLQWYEVSPEADSPHSALRRPVVHESAFKQATGEAVYTNDMAPRQGRGSVAVFIWASVCLCTCASVCLCSYRPSSRPRGRPSTPTTWPRDRVGGLLLCLSLLLFISFYLGVCVSLYVCFGLSMLHSAFTQATGKVVYTDDMAPRKRKGPLILPSVCLSLHVCVGLSVLQSVCKQATGQAVYTNDMAPRQDRGPVRLYIRVALVARRPSPSGAAHQGSIPVFDVSLFPDRFFTPVT